MANTQLDKTLSKIEYLFRVSGMNLESSKKTRRQNFRTTCLFCFNIIWLDLEVAGVVWWLIKSAKHGASFLELTYVAPVFLIQVLCNVKSISFFVYDKNVNEIISTLRRFEMESTRERDAEKDKIVKNETTLLNLIVRVMILFNWALFIIFPIMTFTLMGIKYYRTNEWELMLPLIVEYPFDEYNIKIWPFVFLAQLYSDSTLLFQITGVDLFFYISTSFIRLHLKLLQHDIERCIGGRSDFRDMTRASEISNFVHLVNRHQELIHCVDLVEIIYSKSILFNFLSSSLMICVCGFNTTNVHDIMFIQSFGSFLVSLIQIFFICLFGHLLTDSSTQVGEGVYNSKWYLANVYVGKELNIIQTRAHKGCVLSAFGFADVNLLSFTTILSTAWSYFALLQTLYH